jgi:hypothetical protein
MALIDDLERMAAILRPQADRAFYDTLRVSPALLRAIPPAPPSPNGYQFAGIRMTENPMFPFVQICGTCGGSGEGVTSTFCPQCHGAGKTRIDGVMTGANDTMAVIVHYFPPKPVRWPESVRVPKRPSQGIRSAPLPGDIRKP